MKFEWIPCSGGEIKFCSRMQAATSVQRSQTHTGLHFIWDLIHVGSIWLKRTGLQNRDLIPRQQSDRNRTIHVHVVAHNDQNFTKGTCISSYTNSEI